MKKITFELPIFNLINQGPLKLEQTTVPVELELSEGEHVFTSPPIELGTFFHFTVFGHISIPYTYDAEMNYITVCGPNDDSDRQLTIHTNLEQHAQFGASHKSINTNVRNTWADFLNKVPAIKQATQVATQHSRDTLVSKLLESDVEGVIETGPAPIIDPSNYQAYKDMFLPDKEGTEQPSLDDIYELQTQVDSTYYGTITWTLNYAFANIIGSTGDKKPTGYSSWIRLWADTCNNGYNTTKCSSYGYSDGHSGFTCGTSFVGGHVIPGKVASSVAHGGTAYIFPICKAHNNNDNIYMSSRYNPKGVVLHNYHNP